MTTLRLTALLGACALTGAAAAQEADIETQLAQAMHSHVAVAFNQRTGELVPAPHCRRAPQGCAARVRVFAGYIARTAAEYDLDPWLLTAMAFRESSFNPFAMGSKGEMGLFQIHPRSPWAKRLRFMRDERYRERCRRHPGACQQEVVEQAAVALSRALEVCQGGLADALGAYNTGRCGGNASYAEKVLRERNRLRQSIERPERLDRPEAGV